MELFTPGHLLPVIVVAAVVLFGWRQLPDMARSAGRSLRVFRSELNDLSPDRNQHLDSTPASTPPGDQPPRRG